MAHAGEKPGFFDFLRGLFGKRADEHEGDDPAPPPLALPPPPSFRIAPRSPTTVDFPAMLGLAGIDEEQQRRVTKAQDLLRTLPVETPAAVKRQIVEAAFTAFDVPTEKIIEAATKELDAFHSFIASGRAATTRTLEDSTARIAELETEIAEVRASMAAAVADQEVRDAATTARIASVEPILGFFSHGDGHVTDAVAGGANGLVLDAELVESIRPPVS